MTSKNPYLINTKLPEIATVFYFDEETGQNLTQKEWNSLHSETGEIIIIDKSCGNYISEKEGVGPCSDDNYCDCSCRRKSECNHLINYKNYGGEGSGASKGSLKYKLDLEGVELKEKVSASFWCKKTDYDEINYVNASGGARIGLTSEGVNLGAKAGIDLVKYENEDGLKARVGLNVDTGGTVGKDGIEVKVLGLGFSLGKKNEISTPFGGISKESDDCIIQ